MAEKERPSWDEYFMDIAFRVATRSNCLRREVGAVIVKGRRILCTGYNGPPSGITHCSERGCLREQLGIPSGERRELSRAICAEMNAFVQAARYGIAVEGADIYVTTFPCSYCAKMIINVGLQKVYYVEGYPDQLSKDLLDEAGIECIQMKKPVGI
ncbi:MAG: cytidine/deoxycytidylate deaminase family protein [Acidobacteria bacterium]|nr:cytidine/deoxycytidylate deaminase family protein [Acidobacteriota bacterium]